MSIATVSRYALILCAAVYSVALALLCRLGVFPAPAYYDVSRLARSPLITLEGQVIQFPETRWGRTRFLLQGRAEPLTAFFGRTVIHLDFPVIDLAPGERVRVRGWLSHTRLPSGRRRFNEREYWAARRAYAVLKVWSPDDLIRHEDERPLPRWQRWTSGREAWEFHQRFKAYWFARLPRDEAALLSGMTLGSRGILSPEIKNQCVRAGIYHMLVVSGQNVALVIGAGVLALRLMRVPHRWSLAICIIPIIFYTAAVGADPPVLRASIMALVGLTALAIGRDIPGPYPFALAWFSILLVEPEALFGASFQLSFGATASLLICLGWLRNGWMTHRPVARWLTEAAAVSLAVQVGIGPLLAHYFQQLSLAGVFANWTLFPVSGFIMMAGLILGTWGVLSPDTVPALCIAGMHYVLKGMLALIAWMSGWRWAAIEVPAPSATACVVYYGVLICILIKIHHEKKPNGLSQSRHHLQP